MGLVLFSFHPLSSWPGFDSAIHGVTLGGDRIKSGHDGRGGDFHDARG